MKSPFALIVLAAMMVSGCATKKQPPPPTPTAVTTSATATTTPGPDATATMAALAQPAATPPPAEKKIGKPLLATILSLPGEGLSKIFPKKARPPQAQPPRLIGVVKMVNKPDGFVLIDAITQSAAPGALLVCITNQKETANLRMSNLKNPPFLIADIASGSPAPGDRVFIP